MEKQDDKDLSIAYQNKDIASKVFAEYFGHRSLNVYGLHLPPVRRLLPTNLPVIQADELKIDNLFELEDDTLALLDYESAYRELDKLKYGKYLLRVSERFRQEKKPIPTIRMIVLYTGDVTREQVRTDFDRVGYRIHIEPAFLSELNSEEIRERLTHKVLYGEPLSQEEIMEFIILPLSYPGREEKERSLEYSVRLAEQIEEEKDGRFILSGLLVFADKVASKELKRRVKERITMTWLGKMYQEEKEAEVADAVNRARDEMKAEVNKKLAYAVENMVKRMKVPVEAACEIAGLSLSDYHSVQSGLQTG